MGVSKHIIYLRKDSIPALLIGNPRLARLVQKGKILLVMWVLGEGAVHKGKIQPDPGETLPVLSWVCAWSEL